jgi:hypothetical protein
MRSDRFGGKIKFWARQPAKSNGRGLAGSRLIARQERPRSPL